MILIKIKNYKGIILIDDVITTGTTLEHYSSMLSSISELPVIKIALTETVNLSLMQQISGDFKHL